MIDVLAMTRKEQQDNILLLQSHLGDYHIMVSSDTCHCVFTSIYIFTCILLGHLHCHYLCLLLTTIPKKRDINVNHFSINYSLYLATRLN